MGPASLVVLPGLLLFFAVLVAVGMWVALDARAHDSSHPILWAVFASIPPGIILLYYAFWWRRHRDRTQPQSRWEHYAATVAVAGLGGFAITALLAPPDPVTQTLVWPIVFAGSLPVAYWLAAA
ncbi:Sec-independent protein translocase protein TatCsubunit [Halapricum desulfuricans]|uniref:Sec-independent protein translocase protein TatCsubunit n=1 Tax=Halapricum desulfuricans TaxID=2841257 RepID=A0A897NP86_9EURY|nr:hypothetical protein [Halapricum desulfuricans]QSG12649.1 Sec-independent protein translocase protein TatCsubunit [Halapricum desulfuricans]